MEAKKWEKSEEEHGGTEERNLIHIEEDLYKKVPFYLLRYFG